MDIPTPTDKCPDTRLCKQLGVSGFRRCQATPIVTVAGEECFPGADPVPDVGDVAARGLDQLGQLAM